MRRGELRRERIREKAVPGKRRSTLRERGAESAGERGDYTVLRADRADRYVCVCRGTKRERGGERKGWGERTLGRCTRGRNRDGEMALAVGPSKRHREERRERISVRVAGEYRDATGGMEGDHREGSRNTTDENELTRARERERERLKDRGSKEGR